MKANWKKILFITLDIIIASYLAVVFVMPRDKKKDNKTVCRTVNIDIADKATNGFLDAKILQRRLVKSGLYPKGKTLGEIDTRTIEESLKKTPFVQTAECYKTQGGNVYIKVTQRMPVIRIMAENGDDYYVDDNDRIMPKSHYTSDLIIATGNISRSFATEYMSLLGRIIMGNKLWCDLIEQINVNDEQGIEIVPRLGDHIVYLGKLPNGKNRRKTEEEISSFMQRKMERLTKFYKYGLSQVGWNKYSYIDIQFDNQIICKKNAAATHASKRPVTPTPATDNSAQPTAASPDDNNAQPNDNGNAQPNAASNANANGGKPKANDSKPKANDSKPKANASKAKP